jgi:diguanylate cyclase (GGDEF)-like protein
MMRALPNVRPVRVPLRALILSLAAMIVPIAGTMFSVNGGAPQDLLLWVSALIPPFLMSYYRGWKGSAGALALGMATMVLAQSVASGMGAALPAGGTLLAMLTIFIFTCLGAGWLSNALHQHRIEAEKNALTDPLTGLANRAHLEMFLSHRFAAAMRGHTRLAIVFFDIDHFKHWNDELGHDAGDQALIAFADVLKRNMRAENLGARYGGEEFVAVLNEADYPGVMVFVERIREGLRHIRPYGRKLTVSIGVAFQWQGLSQPGDMLAAADAAVYSAKAAGRDCVRVFGRETEDTRKEPAGEPPPSDTPAVA